MSKGLVWGMNQILFNNRELPKPGEVYQHYRFKDFIIKVVQIARTDGDYCGLYEKENRDLDCAVIYHRLHKPDSWLVAPIQWFLANSYHQAPTVQDFLSQNSNYGHPRFVLINSESIPKVSET